MRDAPSMFVRIGLLVVCIIAGLSTHLTAHRASAVSTGLWVAPSDVVVDGGGTFTVQLMQHADVATTGAQADFSFDRTSVQVTNVVASATYSTGYFATSDLAVANSRTGVFTVGTFITPDQPPLPVGDNTFATITMAALPGVNGTVNLSLSQAYMVNGTYDPLSPLALTNGVVHLLWRDHKTDANGDGYSAADEITIPNCGVASCASITMFGIAETNTCKDAGRQCGVPNPPVDESGPARTAPPPAIGYGCSVTLDIVPPLTTKNLAKSDVDLDGVVSILDLSKVSGWFGNTINASPTDPRREGDMDGDGVITTLDLSAISANFGRSVADNCRIE